MFVYDNGKLNILTVKKCGHAAMIHYFNNAVESDPDNRLSLWLFGDSPKVAVIRHPVERMHSAINWYRAVSPTGRIPADSNEFSSEEYIFNQHCRPYMWFIQKRDFRIIRFEQLIQYIPKATFHDTKTRNREIDPFPTNRYFNREDMLREIEAYHNILETKQVITPEEWKELT